MINLFNRIFGAKKKSGTVRRQRDIQRPRLGRAFLAGERLEFRELLSADAATAVSNAPAAMVASQQTPMNNPLILGTGNTGAISDEGPPAPGTSMNSTGSLGTGAMSDQGPPAPGTNMNPTGSLGTGTVSDQGPPAPGTNMNPTGSLGTGTIGDQGPPAPGTNMNPTGSLGTSTVSDQGLAAPGTTMSNGSSGTISGQATTASAKSATATHDAASAAATSNSPAATSGTSAPSTSAGASGSSAGSFGMGANSTSNPNATDLGQAPNLNDEIFNGNSNAINAANNSGALQGLAAEHTAMLA